MYIYVIYIYIYLYIHLVYMHTHYHITLQRWHWGMNTWHIIEKKLMEAQLFKDNHVNVIRRGNEGAKDELLCFDDLYLSARTGHWL